MNYSTLSHESRGRAADLPDKLDGPLFFSPQPPNLLICVPLIDNGLRGHWPARPNAHASDPVLSKQWLAF